MLVRFLCSREEQIRRSRDTSEPPTIPQLYQEPEVLAKNPYFPLVLKVFRAGITLRPSRAAGKTYPEVSRAYWEAVYRVLTRKKSGQEAAEELQQKLETLLKSSAVRETASLEQKATEQR